jgi:hypothetical protein
VNKVSKNILLYSTLPFQQKVSQHHKSFTNLSSCGGGGVMHSIDTEEKEAKQEP